MDAAPNYLSNTLSDYLNTPISTTGWVFWLLILAFVFFLLWLFFGRGDYEYIGLSPLKIGVDSTKYVNGRTYAVVEKSNKGAKKVSGSVTPSESNVNTATDTTSFEPSITGNRLNSNVIPINNITSINNNTSNNTSINNITSINKYCEEQISKALGIYKEYKTNRISRGEQKCKDVVEDIYGVPFFCMRPNFLKNPETKRNLELDLYNDDLKIAVERNGIQHYVWPNYTNSTKEQFINQLRRDKFKRDQCDINGIYLITVPYTVEIDEIHDYIQNNLPGKVTYIDNNSYDNNNNEPNNYSEDFYDEFYESNSDDLTISFVSYGE